MKRLAVIGKWLAIGLGVVLVAALIVPYLIPIEPYADVEGPFPESEIAEVDGVRVHYRAWKPDDDPKGNIVFVHGFSGSTFSWRFNVAPLVDAGWQVVAVDVPAFGYSDRAPTVDHSIEARNKYVWSVLDRVTDDTDAAWWLCGHSMGGGIVEAMAQFEPERTAGVIFVDGGGWTLGEQRATRGGLATAAMGFGPVRRWTEVYAKYVAFTEDNIRTLLTSAFGEEPSDEAVHGYLEALQVPRTASAILDQWRGRGDSARTLDPSSITQPCLVIWGLEDTWVPLERGTMLHDALPNSEMVTIEGAGHNVMETHPDEFNLVLTDFLINQGIHRDESATPDAD